MPSHNIAFIGSGNLAWHLAPALDNAGYAVKEVYSQNPKHADLLVKRLYQAERKDHLDFGGSDLSLVVICVADDAIVDIAQEIVLPSGCSIVHTSGSKPMEQLKFAASNQIGVFYPLQTFSKTQRMDFKEVPVFIEANEPETENRLLEAANAISRKVYKLKSGDRKVLHLAAVFACNFTNHFLKISEDTLRSNGFDLDVLKPLIVETMEKALSIGPGKAQTGPAKRHDFEVLDQHMALLDSNDDIKEMYKAISQNIIDAYPRNK